MKSKVIIIGFALGFIALGLQQYQIEKLHSERDELESKLVELESDMDKTEETLDIHFKAINLLLDE